MFISSSLFFARPSARLLKTTGFVSPVQTGVNSEYIVAADIFQDRNDVWTLVPFLKTMEKNLGYRYPSVTADSGYESEEAYTYLREQKQKPYIKPQTYEKWKKRSFKQDISERENMGYDETADTYTCHAGKKLKPLSIKNRKVRVVMNQK